MYFRTELKPIIDDISLRNEHFAIIQDTPFTTGQTFDIEFSKNKSKRNRFQVRYEASDTYPKYTVEWDDNSHTNILKKEQDVKARVLSLLGDPVVYAAGLQEDVDVAQRGTKQTDSTLAIRTLQDSRSDVGSKIVALEQLNQAPAELLSTRRSASAEPPLATVIDLTRHSDQELSYKAKQLLSQIDFASYVAQQLNSSVMKQQGEGELIYAKLNPGDQQKVLDKLGPGASSRLRSRMASVTSSKQVLATGSAQGDRYYVKATWDPNNAATVECLASLFNTELYSHRTLQQERELMKGRKERLVYWYDKDWSIDIAHRIAGCGGTAQYVQPDVAQR